MKTAEGDKSVPITWAYNHHYEAYLTGQYSQMKRVPLYLTKVIFYGGALFPLHN